MTDRTTGITAEGIALAIREVFNRLEQWQDLRRATRRGVRVDPTARSRFNSRSTSAISWTSVLYSEGPQIMAWKPGQTGNAGGRPSYKDPVTGKTLAELAKAHTAKALKALCDVLDNPEAPPAAIVSAATAILDRGHGRPKQDLGIEMKSDDATAALLEQARRRAAALPRPEC